MIPNAILIIIVLIYLLYCLKIIKENHRILIFRLGKYLGVKGPGLILVFYPIDRGIIFDLNKHLPEWQNLTQEEINNKIKEKVLNNPDIDYK